MYLAIVSIFGLVMVKEFPTLDEAQAWAKEKIAVHGKKHYPHAEFIPVFYRVERITRPLVDMLKNATSPDIQHEVGM